MALWGNRDLLGNGGTISINLGTGAVTGSGTTFATSGWEVSQGDVLVVGAGATYGYAVVQSVTDDTNISIATTQYLRLDSTIGSIPTGRSYYVTQRPISSLEDSIYRAPEVRTVGFSTNPVTGVVVGVSTLEQEVARDNNSQYRPAHSGWVGITTYVDQHGNLRVKSEVLVAGSMISDDNDVDDTNFPES